MVEKNPTSVVVVGAGLAGLSAARRVRERWPAAAVTVCEAASRAGGILQTEAVDGYLIEQAADMFTTDPDDALALVRTLGHESDLLTTKPVAERALIATDGGNRPIPRGLSLMLPGNLDAIRESKILDRSGFERLLVEESVPARVGGDLPDEDFQSFVVRRFGQQTFERLVQPLVSGIYTADPRRLSMNATMRRFVDMEQAHGSLIAAAKASAAASSDRTATGARYDLFRAPAAGMGQLIEWLLEALVDVKLRYNWPASKILRHDDQWMIESAAPDQEPLHADAVIVATPAAMSAKLVANHAPKLAGSLAAIESASCAVTVLAFDESQIQRPFDGYGIVVPSALKRQLIAASFSSNKFSGRAPAGKTLVRCFIGGAMQGELVDLSDRQLIDLAAKELDHLVGISGTPELTRVFRWRNAMPQYHVGHLDRIAAIENAVSALPGLELAGNAYRGVGIPICVRSGAVAADQVW